MTTAEDDASYIDYDTFLDPSFSAATFANTLVLGTNNPSDTPLDLTTPLSRVLFDAQEINTHIDTLTTTNALPLLAHTQEQTSSSKRIVQEVDAQVASLNDNYKRLEKEVLVRYETAEEVRAVAERLWETVRLGRAVGRCLQLGRQLEVQMSEITGSSGAGKGQSQTGPRDDHRALIRSANTLLTLRELFSKSNPGEEGEGLDKINVISALRTTVVAQAERVVLSKAQQIVREFSMSSLSPTNASAAPTYNQATETRSRTTSAVLTLYLLSPLPVKHQKWEPELLINALQEYLRAQLSSSLASLARALAALPTLERTTLEVSARCQNILALETLLSSLTPPTHPLLQSSTSTFIPPPNLLQPLLASLETGSLPSYFWRSLAGNLTNKVQDIMIKGGLNARTLKSNRNAVRDLVRECVIKGCTAPAGIGGGKEKKGESAWEREVAVMVGSVMGPLGR
ncbi:Golgi transport complex subunit 5-domain-containing protein [Xylogone sp. PMI_703]|nr:Golgi transport complex subunit 5-domain-containing protein [Xylogone sp. PMI_703]